MLLLAMGHKVSRKSQESAGLMTNRWPSPPRGKTDAAALLLPVSSDPAEIKSGPDPAGYGDENGNVANASVVTSPATASPVPPRPQTGLTCTAPAAGEHGAAAFAAGPPSGSAQPTESDVPAAGGGSDVGSRTRPMVKMAYVQGKALKAAGVAAPALTSSRGTGSSSSVSPARPKAAPTPVPSSSSPSRPPAPPPRGPGASNATSKPGGAAAAKSRAGGKPGGAGPAAGKQQPGKPASRGGGRPMGEATTAGSSDEYCCSEGDDGPGLHAPGGEPGWGGALVGYPRWEGMRSDGVQGCDVGYSYLEPLPREGSLQDLIASSHRTADNTPEAAEMHKGGGSLSSLRRARSLFVVVPIMPNHGMLSVGASSQSPPGGGTPTSTVNAQRGPGGAEWTSRSAYTGNIGGADRNGPVIKPMLPPANAPQQLPPALRVIVRSVSCLTPEAAFMPSSIEGSPNSCGSPSLDQAAVVGTNKHHHHLHQNGATAVAEGVLDSPGPSVQGYNPPGGPSVLTHGALEVEGGPLAEALINKTVVPHLRCIIYFLCGHDTTLHETYPNSPHRPAVSRLLELSFMIRLDHVYIGVSPLCELFPRHHPASSSFTPSPTTRWSRLGRRLYQGLASVGEDLMGCLREVRKIKVVHLLYKLNH